MGHNAGLITSAVSPDDVREVLGENTYETSMLCASSKINKRSRFKPYPFGTYRTALTDALLRQHNFSMVPKGVGHKYGGGVGAYEAEPWGQWHAPVRGQDWGRLPDFDGYYHYASGGVFSARIYTNNPNGDRRIMLGGLGKGRITGDIEFNFNTSREVCPHEFTHPDQANASLAGYRFTLLFGAVEGSEESFENAPWVAQSSSSIGEMLYEGETFERLTITLDRSRSDEMTGSEDDLNMWLAVLCLAPPIVTDENGKYVKVQDDVWASTSRNFSEMRLVSLDMWDDGSIKTDSVLFSRLEDMDPYTRPSVLPTKDIGVSASRAYLTHPESGHVPFQCSMNGYVYRGDGGLRLALNCSPFSTVWFPAGSIIKDLRQYLYWDLYNSSGNLVAGNESVFISEVHGSFYNPERAEYSLGFENGLEDYDTQLPSLPAGKYKLRLQCVVTQVKDDIDYVPEPPVRQVMGELWWEYEDEEYNAIVSDEVASEVEEIEITIR